jgi:hypothetical protein
VRRVTKEMMNLFVPCFVILKESFVPRFVIPKESFVPRFVIPQEPFKIPAE